MITTEKIDRAYDELLAYVRRNGGAIELKTRVGQAPFVVRLHKKNVRELVACTQNGKHIANLTRERLYDIANDNTHNWATDKRGAPHHLRYLGSVLDAMGVQYPIPVKHVVRRKDMLDRVRRDRERTKYYAESLAIGRHGEYLALAIVREQWDEREYTIEHVAEYNDNAGYDICVKRDGKIVVAIEVKATPGGKRTPFFMSEEQRRASKKIEAEGGKYLIYRLYNIGSKRGKKYIVIDSKTLDDDCIFEARQYIVHVRRIVAIEFMGPID